MGRGARHRDLGPGSWQNQMTVKMQGCLPHSSAPHAAAASPGPASGNSQPRVLPHTPTTLPFCSLCRCWSFTRARTCRSTCRAYRRWCPERRAHVFQTCLDRVLRRPACFNCLEAAFTAQPPCTAPRNPHTAPACRPVVVLARQLGATFQLTGMTCLWPKPPNLTTPRWAPDWTAAWHTFLQELLSPLAAYFPEDSEVSVAFIYNTVEVST